MKSLLKIFLVILTIFSFQTSFAGQEDKMNGWAWSSNVGWISFNCTNTDSCGIVNYGVDVDSFGNLSGYAWSSHVGWINFTGVTYDDSDGSLDGDANFVAADFESDGWDDGTLRMSASSPVAYGPVLNDTTDTFEGYAWGSEVIGWVQFNTAFGSVGLDPFSFIFTADQGLTPADRVVVGGNVLLNWVTDGSVLSCTATNGPGTTWTDTSTKSANGSETVADLSGDITFSLTCFNGAGKSITRNLPIYVANPQPSIIFTADDLNIRSGEDAVLNWTIEHADTCTGGGTTVGGWPGPKSSTGGTETISGLTDLENIFSITCTSPYPEYPGSYPAQLTISVDKLVINFEREVSEGEDPTVGRFGQPVTFRYLVENPDSCIIGEDFNTVGSAASSTQTISDFAPFITNNHGTTQFLAANTDIEYTFDTQPLFTDNENLKRDYRFQISCFGPNSQVATSTINISIGRNPNFDEN